MSITILQQPLSYTPSNAQHIYNAVSTLSGTTNFRYVFDIWMNPVLNPEKVARVKVAPNTSGVGIVDVGDIVKNYVKPNSRSETYQMKDYGPFASAYSNPNGQIPFSFFNLQPSNQFNDNPKYPYLPHVTEYQVIVGEEFLSGGTTILNICTNPVVVTSEWSYSLSTGPAPYGGSPNQVTIDDAGVNVPDYASTSLLGFSWLHTTNTGVFVDSGTTTASTGTYEAASEPSRDDILVFTETSTNCLFTFRWTLGEIEGEYAWIFQSQFCPECENNPDRVTTWPGVQRNKDINNYDKSWWGNNNTDGENNHLWWDLYKYKFKAYNQINQENPAQLLTTFGDEQYDYTFENLTGGTTTIPVRKRSHHVECPLLISFFYRDFQTQTLNTTTPYYYGPQGANSLEYYPGSANGSIVGDEPDNRIVYKVLAPYDQENLTGELGLYLETTGTTSTFLRRISEGVVFSFYGQECMSDPQHFLFLNQQGVWDTWTFDRKNIKSYNKENSVYAQGLIRDNSIYNPLFNTQRNVIFDQTIVESVEAQSHFMEENDRRIVEELFLSTNVYLMEDFYNPNLSQYNIDPMEYKKTPHLIPIQITSNTIQEYKQRYNKLFQYTLTYEYNPVQQHRSNL